MRHDPASAAIVVMLRGLKMYGMAGAVSDLIEQCAPPFEAAVPIPMVPMFCGLKGHPSRPNCTAMNCRTTWTLARMFPWFISLT